MRIWGYILLVIGIVFLGAFALATAGGANIGYIPLLIAVFLTLTGWNIVRSGRGIIRAGPAPAALQSGSQTVELPLPPAALEVIKQQGSRSRRLSVIVGAVAFAVFAALGAALAFTDKTSTSSELFFVFALVGVISAVLIIGISLIALLPIGRDARSTTCLRTTGPVQVVPLAIGGALLRLADRAFLINLPRETRALRDLTGGTVEYSPHGHVILAAWDNQGRVVYAAPGYDAQR